MFSEVKKNTNQNDGKGGEKNQRGTDEYQIRRDKNGIFFYYFFF